MFYIVGILTIRMYVYGFYSVSELFSLFQQIVLDLQQFSLVLRLNQTQ